jgi:flagellar basal-body rod protein FlgF
MGSGIYVALSGAIAGNTALDTTAQNLANASTAGYQKLRPVFREVLAAASGSDKVPHRFTAVSRTALDVSEGAVKQTGRALDVALPKATYLSVQTPRGVRYTRGGSLDVDATGNLVTARGEPVLDEGGNAIKVPAGTIPTITADGELRGPTGSLGRMALSTFATPDALVPEGGCLLNAQAAGAATPSKDPIAVGALEDGNVQVVEAMTEMVGTSRDFETFQRAIEAFNEIDRRAASLHGNA